jgi:hypothetical protein
MPVRAVIFASPMRTRSGCSSRHDRWFIIWRRTPAPRFDVFVESIAVGLRKPDPRI